MACQTLLPEFNRRRAELIAQAKESPHYNEIQNKPLDENLFYNAARAGKYWIGPNETLDLFDDYQEPLTQLWDKKGDAT